MTAPTVPLIDGAYYWVRPHGEPWEVALYDQAGDAFERFYADSRPIRRREDPAAISGPIPTPEEPTND